MVKVLWYISLLTFLVAVMLACFIPSAVPAETSMQMSSHNSVFSSLTLTEQLLKPPYFTSIEIDLKQNPKTGTYIIHHDKHKSNVRDIYNALKELEDVHAKWKREKKPKVLTVFLDMREPFDDGSFSSVLLDVLLSNNVDRLDDYIFVVTHCRNYTGSVCALAAETPEEVIAGGQGGIPYKYFNSSLNPCTEPGHSVFSLARERGMITRAWRMSYSDYTYAEAAASNVVDFLVVEPHNIGLDVGNKE